MARNVLRWLGAKGALGDDCELVGVDLNAALTGRAAQLARAEHIGCRFVTGDAFAPEVAIDEPHRTIVISTRLLHHLDPAELQGFFGAHQSAGVHAFAHWDLDPCRIANIGALIHQSRLRELEDPEAATAELADRGWYDAVGGSGSAWLPAKCRRIAQAGPFVGCLRVVPVGR